jgi:polyisoprenoid-binding protein YceI
MTKAKFSKYFIWLFVSIMFSIVNLVKAQSFKIVPKSSNLTIYGTSNLHDWEIKVTQIDGELEIDSSKQISSLWVKIPVRSLKSGKRAMDTKTYASIDDKKNPNIIFQLTESSPIKITDKDVEVIVTGNLTLAGETKKIIIKTTVKITEAGDYQFKGSAPLKMTDFKIKPPTAVFGTLKTRDVVTAKFDITYSIHL